MCGGVGGGVCMGIQSEPGEESASVLLLGCAEVMQCTGVRSLSRSLGSALFGSVTFV